MINLTCIWIMNKFNSDNISMTFERRCNIWFLNFCTDFIMIFKHGVPNNSSQQIIEVHKWSMSADYSSAQNLFKSANYSHKQLNLPQIDYLIWLIRDWSKFWIFAHHLSLLILWIINEFHNKFGLRVFSTNDKVTA